MKKTRTNNNNIKLPKVSGFQNDKLKPIFHCNAKYLVLGVGVGQCQNFALEIPTCWYILVLPNAKICVSPDATPDASQWNIGGVGPSGVGAGIGHVHFVFFVLISFAFCSQRKPSFQWNMGLRDIPQNKTNNNNIQTA